LLLVDGTQRWGRRVCAPALGALAFLEAGQMAIGQAGLVPPGSLLMPSAYLEIVITRR
jgi:hypothetical protein